MNFFNDKKLLLLEDSNEFVENAIALFNMFVKKTFVAKNIKEWKHKSVYTKKEQEDILGKNLIERAAKQIGLFTGILILVSTIIIVLLAIPVALFIARSKNKSLLLFLNILHNLYLYLHQIS